MSKLIVLTDVHANLPALQAAVDSINAEGYDRLVHLGDAISIGPFPAECLELLLSIPNATFIMGNHDKWFADGLPMPQPEWMSDGEVAHQQWTHAQLYEALKSNVDWTQAQLYSALKTTVGQWPYVVEEKICDISVRFTHYALDESGRDFGPIIREPTAADLDQLFRGTENDLILYGHNHTHADLTGRAHYINPGPLGCGNRPEARYTVIDFGSDGYQVEHRAVTYDILQVERAYRERNVPERAFLCKIFFGDQIKP